MRIPETWPRLMRDAVAAAYLAISVSTFNEMVKRGRLPAPVEAYKGMRIRVWDRLDLDRAIDKATGRERRYKDPDEAMEEYRESRKAQARGRHR